MHVSVSSICSSGFRKSTASVALRLMFYCLMRGKQCLLALNLPTVTSAAMFQLVCRHLDIVD